MSETEQDKRARKERHARDERKALEKRWQILRLALRVDRIEDNDLSDEEIAELKERFDKTLTAASGGDRQEHALICLENSATATAARLRDAGGDLVASLPEKYPAELRRAWNHFSEWFPELGSTVDPPVTPSQGRREEPYRLFHDLVMACARSQKGGRPERRFTNELEEPRMEDPQEKPPRLAKPRVEALKELGEELGLVERGLDIDQFRDRLRRLKERLDDVIPLADLDGEDDVPTD